MGQQQQQLRQQQMGQQQQMSQQQLRQQQMSQQQLRQQQLRQQQMNQQQMNQQQMYQQQMNQQPNPNTEQQINGQINALLQNQSNKFQVEINKLKSQLMTSGNAPNTEYLNQIQILNHELTQQRILNMNLQEKIKLNKPMLDDDTESKLQTIELKRREILDQMTKLKTQFKETESIVIEQNENKKNIDLKLLEIRETIGKNLALYNDDEQLDIINTNTCEKVDDIYRYNFSNPINILTSIQITDYSFPETLYNITPSNNTMYIQSENKFQVVCDTQTFYKSNNNTHMITIAPGNYTIEYLLNVLTQVLEQMNISIEVKPGNNFISLTSDKEFLLHTNYDKYDNNILRVLGFNDTTIQNESKSFISNKSYDLRADKTITLYLKNLSSNTAFCKFSLGSNKIFNHTKQLTKPLLNITHLDLDFRDSRNKPIYLGDKMAIVDFTLKTIQNNLPTLNTDINQNACTDDELYNTIGDLMK